MNFTLLAELLNSSFALLLRCHKERTRRTNLYDYQYRICFVGPRIISRNRLISILALQRDRQCTYNVTSRRVRPTIVVVAKQEVLHNLSVCICSLRHPACNAHPPYLRSAPLYNIFSHYLINGTIFGKKALLNTKCVQSFNCTNLCTCF